MELARRVIARYVAVMASLAALGVSGVVAGARPASAAQNYSPPVPAAAPGWSGSNAAHAAAGAYTEIGHDDSFDTDSCPTAAFCIAVGNYYLAGGRVPGLSEALTKGRWWVKPVPSPARGGNVFANEVSCSSRDSCLFIGDHWAGSNGLVANLAEAWNGSAWRIVATANPAGSTFSALEDVACPTAEFCLVTGEAGTSNSRYHDTAYSWTAGKTWRQIPVPAPAGARNSELAGLACSDAAHCMAVGNYTSANGYSLPFAARWTGGHWRLYVTAAIPGQRQVNFNAVSCPTASECVAVGWTEDNTRAEYYHAFAERWSGGTWRLSTLRAAPSQFIGVSCPAAGRCFAAGYTYPSITSYGHQLIETWNGSAWNTQQPAEPAGIGGNLMHVSCVSFTFCEAVGFSFVPGKSNTDQAISEGWNGQRWRAQVTPNP